MINRSEKCTCDGLMLSIVKQHLPGCPDLEKELERRMQEKLAEKLREYAITDVVAEPMKVKMTGPAVIQGQVPPKTHPPNYSEEVADNGVAKAGVLYRQTHVHPGAIYMEIACPSWPSGCKPIIQVDYNQDTKTIRIDFMPMTPKPPLILKPQ